MCIAGAIFEWEEEMELEKDKSKKVKSEKEKDEPEICQYSGLPSLSNYENVKK